MRIPIALVIFVYLAAPVFAEDRPTDWASAHAAALEADQHHDYPGALGHLKQSWDAATTPVQQAISANDLGLTYRRMGRPKDAAPWLERAFTLWRADPHATRYLAETASSLSDLY